MWRKGRLLGGLMREISFKIVSTHSDPAFPQYVEGWVCFALGVAPKEGWELVQDGIGG